VNQKIDLKCKNARGISYIEGIPYTVPTALPSPPLGHVVCLGGGRKGQVCERGRRRAREQQLVRKTSTASAAT
jgi:hypothetical protein